MVDDLFRCGFGDLVIWGFEHPSLAFSFSEGTSKNQAGVLE